MCDFTIYFSSDVKEPQKTFEASVKSGQFGAFQVDKSSFKTGKKSDKANCVISAGIVGYFFVLSSSNASC